MPVESFILRLRSVIRDKAQNIRDGIIKQGQTTVLYTQFNEQPVPRIVRAVLGVGNLILDDTGYSIEYSDEIRKANGCSIETDIFLDPAYSHVSALIYCPADWVNTPKEPETELAVVHHDNPTVRGECPPVGGFTASALFFAFRPTVRIGIQNSDWCGTIRLGTSWSEVR
jgi:hypothetical protein